MTIKEPQLSWTTILVVVAGVLAATGLIFGAGWSVVEAYTLVAVVAVVMVFLVVGVLLAIVPRSDWGAMMAEAKRVMRHDLRALGRMIRPGG